jgi:hypothetical protein
MPLFDCRAIMSVSEPANLYNCTNEHPQKWKWLYSENSSGSLLPYSTAISRTAS